MRPSSAASPSVLFIGEKTLLEYFKAIGDRLSNNELPDLSKDIQRVRGREILIVFYTSVEYSFNL